MSTAHLVEGVRTLIGGYGGGLATGRPDDLAAHALRALRQRLRRSTGAPASHALSDRL